MFHGMQGQCGHGRHAGRGPRGGGRFGGFEVSWEAGPSLIGARIRRRMFDGSELRLLLLKLIADQPRHGYDLIREIEERTNGAYAPSPGVIYPTLTMLDEMGLIEDQKADGAKKVFAITDAGHAELAARADDVAALFARLGQAGAERQRSDKAPIRRAMRNLRTVLQNRLEAGDLSDDAAHQIAALLDEAVQRIERLK